MKFSVAALLVAATGAVAHYNVSTTYTTEVLTAYTTYCPEPTTLTYSDKTYTISTATTLTITDCPCTVVKPVVTKSVVKCYTCGHNATTPVIKPTASYTTKKTPSVPTAGAGKAAALSGAGLAGVLGLAAFVL